MYSKAQVEINETILVIIIFSILAVAGIVIFHRYETASIQASVLQSSRQSFYDLLNQVPNMPELKCSSQNIQEECIDLLKAMSFSKLQSSYIDKLGTKTIRLRLIYPEFNHEECNQSSFQSKDFPNCDNILLYTKSSATAKSTEKISSPIAVYDTLNDRYLLGLLEIEWQY